MVPRCFGLLPAVYAAIIRHLNRQSSTVREFGVQ